MTLCTQSVYGDYYSQYGVFSALQSIGTIKSAVSSRDTQSVVMPLLCVLLFIVCRPRL